MLLRGLVAEALGTCAGAARAAGSDAARRGAARTGYGAVLGIDAEALADELFSLSLPPGLDAARPEDVQPGTLAAATRGIV